MKQAIINSKQQSFKNLEKSNKLKDQVRLEAVHSDNTESPPPPAPTAKEFFPSPELSSFYTPDNRVQDHFHPVNQYMRIQPQHDAQFPNDNHFNVHHPIIDTKWLGSNRTPMHDNLRPPDLFPHFYAQHGLRNTNVEFKNQHAYNDRHVNFPPHHHHHYHQPPQISHSIRGGELTGERSMVFPTDSNPLNMEEIVRQVPALPTKSPGLTITERSRGTWKWIPDSDEETANFNPHTKFSQHEFQSHQTSRDRPYSFESSDIFSQQTTPPSGPSSWRSSGSSETEEITGRPEEGEKLDVKLLRFVASMSSEKKS